MKRKHVNMTTKQCFTDQLVHGTKYIFTMNTIFDQHDSYFCEAQNFAFQRVLFRRNKHVFGLPKPTDARCGVVTNMQELRFF